MSIEFVARKTAQAQGDVEGPREEVRREDDRREEVRREDESPGEEKRPEDETGPREDVIGKEEVATSTTRGDELDRMPVEDRLLTTMLLVGAGALLGSSPRRVDCSLLPPRVPDGSLLSRTYPNRPFEEEPQSSKPKPGHFSSQEPVDTVLAGA